MLNILSTTNDYINQHKDKRTFLPAELYLPEWANDTEFFRDICILLAYLENSLKDFSNPKYAEIEQYYKDIAFKFKDIMQLSEDALKAVIIENGFGSILELFNLPLDRLQMFTLYLPLFKALKGSEDGFKQLLSMLSYSLDIVSWIDNPQELEEYTYNIASITFLNVGFDADILTKLVKFSRTYVYPVLRKAIIQVMFRQLSPAVYGRPILAKSIKVKCFDGP